MILNTKEFLHFPPCTYSYMKLFFWIIILFNLAAQIWKRCGRSWDENLCPPGEAECR